MSQNSKDLAARDQSNKMTITVLTVFQEINKVQAATKTHIFELVKLFKSHPSFFQTAFEIAYLKIFKIFHEKANRKMPPKYQTLATNFFQEILSKDTKSDSPSIPMFNNFLQMLAQGVFSTYQGIRITTSRMLFHLIKVNSDHVSLPTRKLVLKSIYHLIRLKVSTYKQIGIKLASLVLGWQDDIKNKVELELFKILAQQQNQQIRKMTITNLMITSHNIDRILIRLRDKCPDIRSIIIRKLIGQKYPLEEMSVSNRYHLLYDGFGNKESNVQQDTIKYFSKFFDDEDKKLNFIEFVELFRPNCLLVHPHLYTLFDSLLTALIQELPVNNLIQFTRKLTTTLKATKAGNHRQPLHQLIWLKNIGRSQNSQLKGAFEQCIPSGLELSKLLIDLIESKDIFSINECLQIFSLQKSSDELGRNKMFDSLKKAITDLQYFQIDQNWQVNENDDICQNLTVNMVKQKKMLLSYFDLPLISNSYDLIYEIGFAMKSLWPDHYEIQLKQVMAQWNNPEENNLLKERELTLANIKKVEGQPTSRLAESLQAKLAGIQDQLQRQSTKTRLIILTLTRLRSTSSMQDFMPVIKQDLAKQDQSQGLILLGLYCLDAIDRIETFLPLYWMHLTNSGNTKLHILVSLKVTTDFMIKFNMSNFQNKIGQVQQFTYQKYIKKIMQLILSPDADTRILAIECLCRLIFHNRVEQNIIGSCFMRLLMLWWESNSEQVSARSVHTISIFIKQYIERGSQQIRKISQSLCIFFKILLHQQSQRRIINKRKIIYNLKIEEFIKKSVTISMAVLKYHKQSRQIIWKYQNSGAELGPQQLFLLFLFKHQDLHFCLQKAINIADFHEEAPLETLILVKKQIQLFLNKSQEGGLSSTKKLQTVIKKLQQQIEEKIQIKNQQMFNEELLNGLKNQLQEYQLLINSETLRLAKQLQQSQIFIQNYEAAQEDLEDSEEENSQQDIQNMDEVIAQIQEAANISPSESASKDVKKQQKNKRKNKRLSNISEDNEEEQKERNEDSSRNQSNNIKMQIKNERRNNRKRAPSPILLDQQEENNLKKQNIICGRTRSKHRV